MSLDDDFSTFDALIFDCDGTLVDTMPAHYAVWVEVLGRHGLTFDEPTFYSWGGVAAAEVVRRLATQQQRTVDAIAVAGEKERHFAEVGTRDVQPITPVVAIADRFRQTRPLGVATGGVREVCTKLLTRVGIFDWFGTLVTAEDVERGKPDPETFALAARRLGVDAARCVAFEDADPGLESARAAGMPAVDVRPWVGMEVGAQKITGGRDMRRPPVKGVRES